MAVARWRPGARSGTSSSGRKTRPLKTAGLLYQLGGLAALVLVATSDVVFAVTTALGNLWVAQAIWRNR